MTRVLNIAAYLFTRLDGLVERRERLRAACRQRNLRGTILLAPEGVNLFLAGEPDRVEEFLSELRNEPAFAPLEVKRSYSDSQPFRRLLVRLKNEIIAFGVEGIDPSVRTSPKMPAEQLQRWLDEGRDFTLLDVRNDYEVEVGTFAGATAAGIDNFRDFPEVAEQFPEDWKQKPLVMFCTGGIRCEKAGPLLERQGFQQVYQLDGGILKYFEQCGGEHYEGDCFVFDHRVALDPQLSETPDVLCFACQSIVSADDQKSPHYVAGESCPSCHRSDQQQLAETLRQRNEAIRKATTPLPGSQPYRSCRPLKISAKFDGLTALEVLNAVAPFRGLDTWRLEFENGRVLRDDQPLAADAILRSGQRIEHYESDVVEPDVNADIRVLYEDAAIVVVDKPAPLPMHPCGRFNKNTLTEILNSVYAPERIRVGHRLDANTTGLVVLSRRRSIASQLQPQFSDGHVEKTYLALVSGRVDSETFQCEAPIRSQPLKAGLREVDLENGLPARTDFRVLAKNEQQTLLEVRPRTGRTNQIRIHLWWLGHPIVGDPSYLADRRLSQTQTREVSSQPMCLHAWKLQLDHPSDGRRIELSAPLPSWARGFDWNPGESQPLIRLADRTASVSAKSSSF